MAGFNGLQFIFDGIPSSFYNLCIADFDGAGFKTNSAGSNVQIIEDEILRRPTSYFYGVSQTEKLQFEITIISNKAMSRTDVAIAQKWLFGQTKRKKLQIVQCDLDGVYFDCMLTNPQVVSIGNVPRGFTCTVVCDAPWAWEFPRTSTFATQEVETTLEFYNSSDNSDYLYPIIQFTLDANTTSVIATNPNDGNRVFAFENISPNETIYVNNDLEIITSSTGLNRLPNFNGKWFRFKQGLNRVRIIGGLSSAQITYQFARKVGS